MENVHKLTEQITENMNSLLLQMDKSLAEINALNDPIVHQARTDINSVLESVKAGDATGLQNIIQKYANLHR
jgi:uncharacterized protein YoxC